MATHQERLDPFNGLLLLPNLDTAFDLGYIGFEATGKVRISTELEQPDVLGVHDALSVNLDERHLPYLEQHMEQLFRG